MVAGFWRTNGRQILDANGQPVRMTGINWFGFETNNFCPHGLWARNLTDVLQQIRSLGYNTIRLPYANQMFDPGSTANGIDFGRNPELQGLSPLQIMDRVINHFRTTRAQSPSRSASSRRWWTIGPLVHKPIL